MPRWDAKSDTNQQEIIDGLRAVGCSVFDLHRLGQGLPDLLVGVTRNGIAKNYLLEVKTEHGRLTKAEREFFDTWRGQRTIVHSIEEALSVVMEGGDD